ncbi:urease accessory protein UreF [Ornithinimicrobium avium]|uniref:Urease accessory protein UreF n=2 Tax=Ornithinimicrobium avium TaxID=2283195 RepID=A0A345NSR9_9MICO|nr:urease accessory protein UreF [Ornithinimicrobium avium]
MVADGRFPSGSYAHSGGLESAVRHGWVRDLADLEGFLLGRAATTGLMNASFAAAAHGCAGAPSLLALDAELLARTPSPALRRVGVDLGRMLLRAAQRICPHPVLDEAPPQLQQPLVYGLVARAVGAPARAAAAAVLHETVTGPATAAVKLMHVDPFTTHRAVLRLAPRLDDLADRAVLAARGDPADLPSPGAPLSDVAAEQHRDLDARLFAS